MSLTLSIIALIMSVISLALTMWRLVPFIKRHMMMRKFMKFAKSPEIKRMANSFYGTRSKVAIIDEWLTAEPYKKEGEQNDAD